MLLFQCFFQQFAGGQIFQLPFKSLVSPTINSFHAQVNKDYKGRRFKLPVRRLPIAPNDSTCAPHDTRRFPLSCITWVHFSCSRRVVSHHEAGIRMARRVGIMDDSRHIIPRTHLPCARLLIGRSALSATSIEHHPSTSSSPGLPIPRTSSSSSYLRTPGAFFTSIGLPGPPRGCLPYSLDTCTTTTTPTSQSWLSSTPCPLPPSTPPRAPNSPPALPRPTSPRQA